MIYMLLLKNDSTNNILKKGLKKDCVKLGINNIVFPTWNDLGLIGMMFRQCIATKEQPLGNIYDESKFQTVLRIINGRVLINGKPDCYCWNISKVQSSKSINVIGTHSSIGIINMCNVLNSILEEHEKEIVANMFANLNKDLLLVTTEPEKRLCIEITSELYNTGITACVDEWMETDENGYATATLLNIGDYLIVTKSGVYCIRKREFEQTHSI